MINHLKFKFSNENLRMARDIDHFLNMDFENRHYFIQHFKVRINLVFKYLTRLQLSYNILRFQDTRNSNTECLTAEMLVAKNYYKNSTYDIYIKKKKKNVC